MDSSIAARFMATLSPEQHKLYLELEDSEGETRDAQHRVFEDEIIRHLPGGLEPMFRLLFAHLGEQTIDEQGVCCTESTDV
jgi:hypothetical protein